MGLKEYHRKRKFDSTPEPKGDEVADEAQAKRQDGGGLRYVVQMHAASRLHFDFRLEMDGVFKSWAVPKGPTLNPTEQRLAVFVEDHPLDYGTFEGVIPKGNYGAGTVMIWDAGTYIERSSQGREDSKAAMLAGLSAGHLTFLLSGHRLAGEFALIRLEKDRTGKSWLLVKKRDDYARRDDDEESLPVSVATGRTIREIAAEAPAKGQVWRPGKGPDSAAALQGDAPFEPPTPEALQARRKPHRHHSLPAPAVSATEPAAEKPPRRLAMMLPTIRTEADRTLGAGVWLFEPRLDGQRALAVVEAGRASLSSRQHLSFDSRYPTLTKALVALGRSCGETLVLDGEIAVLDDAGHVSEPLLKGFARAKQGTPVLFLYDLLHQGGVSLRELPLAERRRRLSALAPHFGAGLRLTPWTPDESQADAEAAYEVAEHAAAALGAAGVMARHADSPYVAGTSPYWIKLPPPGARADAAPSLSQVPVTNLDRLYWPKESRTKGDLIGYYKRVADVMLPYLMDRPHSLHRHPEGISGEGFYQKDLSGYHPPWVATTRVYSESIKRTIDYLVCRNTATLIYMANLGCIEINPWLSRVADLERPDYAVIDLDPDKSSDTQNYDDVVTVALAFREELERDGLTSFVKTSGATGMHIFLPLAGEPTFESARALAEGLARRVESRYPALTTLERNPNKRRGRMYLDCWQNRRGQTLAAAYSVRPRPGAPVSAPLAWSEVRKGLTPLAFTVDSMPARLERLGDLWAPLAHAISPQK